MVLIPAAANLPSAVTAQIELPTRGAGHDRIRLPSQRFVTVTVAGVETASVARETGRAFGVAVAAEARDDRESAARDSRQQVAASPPVPPAEPPARDAPAR